MDRWTVRLSRLLMVIAALWAFGLAIYIFIDVLWRAFDVPLAGTHEVIRTSIVMIAYMQIAYCVVSRSMLRADFVLHLIPLPVQRTINVGGYLLGAAVFAMVCYGSVDPTIRTWVTGDFDGEGALRVPIWPSQLTVLLTSGLIVLNYLMLAIKEICGISDTEVFG
jgi:TRAP-type C4-dicarboxylate transport system permease small subunit